jgi:hypothetical protein
VAGPLGLVASAMVSSELIRPQRASESWAGLIKRWLAVEA